jgi:hypothetical protein
MYLHELGNEVDSFTKEDMAQGKHLLSNITLNPEEPGLSNPKAQIPPQSTSQTVPVNSTQTVNSKEPARPSKQNIQQNPAWKTVTETGAPPPVNPSPSLNPEEWPDALSQSTDQTNKKKKVTPSNVPSRTVETSPPRESPEPSPQTKSALPSTASWASKITNDPNTPEDDKLRDKTNLTKKNGIVPTLSSPVNRNPTKAQPVLSPTATNTTTDPRISKLLPKKQSEWRKTSSAPVPHEDEINNSDSDSENHKSRQSNDTEESDDYDDGIDNATYDERMSRLSLNDINTSRVSDSHSEDNDTEETSSPPVENNNTINTTNHKQTVSDPPLSTQQPSKSTNIYQELNFDPNDLQGFADWLRLRFTDLLLDNSNDKNLPLNLPLLWNTPCSFLGNSLTTRSRFDFARHEESEIIIPHRAIPTSSAHTGIIPNIQTTFHSAPPGYDHHVVGMTGYPLHHHHHGGAIPQMAGPLRQPTLAHPFPNHTMPYHTQKTHI